MNKHRLQQIIAAFAALLLFTGPLSDARAAYDAPTDAYALTATAGSPDIVYQVTPGESVALDSADFREYFYAHVESDTFRYVMFQSDSSLKASNGVLYANYGAETETAFTRNALEDARFYDRSSMYGSYPLEAVRFVSNRQANGNAVTMNFTAYGDSGSCTGRLSITISGAAAVVTSSSSVVDLTWHVTAGEILRFDRNDFRDFFNDRASDDSFRYVTFQPDASFQPDNGRLYYDFEGRGQREFTADTLRDADFYYSSSRYGSYPISGLTFLAANEGGGNLVRLTFTVFGRTERYSGSLVIQIDWANANGAATTPVTPVTTPATNAETSATEPETPPVETPATNPEAAVPETPSNADNGGAATETPVPDNSETLESQDADILYIVRAGERQEFNAKDFTAAASGTLRYVTFSTDDVLSPEDGLITADAGGLEEVTFTSSTIDDFRFYVDSENYGDYPIDSLAFTAPVTAAARTVRVRCTLYNSSRDSTTVTMSIQLLAADPSQLAPRVDTPDEPETPDTTQPPATPDEPEAPDTQESETPPSTEPEPPKREPVNVTEPFTGTPVAAGNILYAATCNESLRFVSDDFDRFFRAAFPGGTLSHVNFQGLPANGSLFYDYYTSSAYGDIHKLELTAANITYLNFYFSPAFADRCSLAELMYISASELNSCEVIPFSATGLDSSGAVVQCTGNVYISVTKSLITDVYGAIPIGRTVTLPASNIAANVKEATGADMSGLRFLELPAVSVGTVAVGDDNAPADTAQVYYWPEGEPLVSALHFIPAENFTGSVDIPYIALNADGAPIGIGHFTLGIISSLKRFNDVPSSLWCYKYVTELAAAGVVGGYSNDTYRPDISVTWGAALKLIMLAAGYDEQPGSSMSPFQGYLDKAVADGLLPHEIDLWEPVTRLEVAELAAAAMKLDTAYLSSIKPFSDTDNLSVQALNAAGIINGYYNEGESTFRPSGTLTRGQAAAIVWRMRNYEG